MEQLKPCPFCGSENIVLNQSRGCDYEDENGNIRYFYPFDVGCMDCGETTYRYVSAERAIEAWNRRVTDVDNH